MTSTKTIGLLLIILGGFAIWVNAQGKFEAVLKDIETSTLENPSTGTQETAGQLTLAIVFIIFIASILPDDVAVTFLLIAAVAGIIWSPNLLSSFAAPASAAGGTTGSTLTSGTAPDEPTVT